METLKFIPSIIGHRGGRGLLYPPENTLAAFEAVLKENGDGIEFDILKTKDDHLVVFHDDFMHELTNIPQSNQKNAIELYTFKDLESNVRLRRVPLSSEYLHLEEANQITDYKIPTFQQVLDLLVSYKTNPHYLNDSRIQNFLLNVEIKQSSTTLKHQKQPTTNTANQVFDTIQTYLNSQKLTSHNFMISSFDFSYLKVIQERNESLIDKQKQLPIGVLMCRDGAINDTDLSDIENGIDRLIKLGIKPQSINLPIMCFIKSPDIVNHIRKFHTQLKIDKPLQILAWPYKEQNVPALSVQQKNQLLEIVNQCKLDYLLSDNPIEMKKEVFNITASS